MPVIVSGGAYRSGSTFIHNVILRLLKYNYIKHDTSGADQEMIDRMIQLKPEKTWVLKSHVCIPGRPESHTKYIRTKRNKYGVLRSHFYVKGIPPSKVTRPMMERACRFINEQNMITKQYKDRPDCLTIHYDQIVSVPYFVVDTVDQFLGIKSEYKVKERIVNELTVDKIARMTKDLKEADPREQWRPNHISPLKGSIDGWMDTSEKFLKLAQEFF